MRCFPISTPNPTENLFWPPCLHSLSLLDLSAFASSDLPPNLNSSPNRNYKLNRKEAITSSMPVKIRPQSLHSPSRYFPSASLGFFSRHAISSLSRQFCSPDDDVESVFRIVTNSSTSKEMQLSLNSSGVSLTNDLIDKILKRFRFSHANPSQAFEFFVITSRRRGFYHTPFSLDTILYILGRNRKFDQIWEVLIETKRKDQSLISTRTIQVVLARIAKVCSVRQTVESFRRFRKLVPEFDTKCFNALLRTLCQEKSMADARNVYHCLKHDFRPNLQTFNILLSGWKSSEEAEGFFEEMREMGVKPDVVSYNCLIDVYCKNRQIEKAWNVVDNLREDDMEPDVISYTSIIGGLGLVGQPDKARDVLKEMEEYGCYPDTAAYNAVIRNFCIAKRLGDAYIVLDEMVQKGLSPNPTTYNVFFRSFYWSNDLRGSWSLYQRMKESGCLPNTQSCMFLVRLCRRQEKVDMALELWNDMVDKGFGSFTLVSDVLFDLLCDMGKLVEAEQCFLQMAAKGQKPSHVSFRRIKVLMELANRQEALQNLSEKMAAFGSSVHLPEREDDPIEISSSEFISCCNGGTSCNRMPQVG